MELEMIARPLTHVTIDGKRIALFKLSLGDIADLDQYLRDEYEQDELAKAVRIYGEVPDKVSDRLMAGLTSDEMDELRGSTKGARFMLWRALQAGYPSITQEQAANAIPVEDIERVVDAISPKEKKTKKKTAKK